MSAPGSGPRGWTIEHARALGEDVAEAALAFHRKLQAGSMEKMTARRAVAEFVRAYTTVAASPYKVVVQPGSIHDLDDKSTLHEVITTWGKHYSRGRDR